LLFKIAKKEAYMRMNFRILTVIALLFVSTLGFSQVFVVNEVPIDKFQGSEDDKNFINSLVSYTLNDSYDFLPYDFVSVPVLQDWYNVLVDVVNATNTNVTIVKGKPVPPKKLAPIVIKKIDATTLKNITSLIPQVKGVVSASYSISKTDLLVNIQLLDNTGKVLNKKSVSVPLANLVNREGVILAVKEALVDLFSAWRYYYYDPKRQGSVSLTVTPNKGVVAVLKPNDIPLPLGKNVSLPEGEYTLIVQAPGFAPVVTNIYVAPNSQSKIALKLVPSPKMEYPVPMGLLYLDADVKGVPVIIAEGNIFGTTPLYTNVIAGEKNVIFQQTANTLLKTVKLNVQPDVLNYFYVTLDKVGAGVTISANDGAFVVIDRKLEGVISSGSFSKNLSRGIHTITVFKSGFEPFRTNVNITSDEKITLKVSLNPRKVPVFVVTPESSEVTIRYQGKAVGITPKKVLVEPGKDNFVELVAQDVGFNNTSFNITPSMNSINSRVIKLSPLFGDLLVLTDPTEAIVKFNERIVGTTSVDGLLVRGLPARKGTLIVRKEGYRAIKTNVFIQPNIQNSFSFKLKEAPIKLFINTLPVQNVDVYMNEEYYGENDGVINVEIGNFVMKLVKPGYKTIYTNVSFPSKVDTVIPLTFSMTSGLSEPEVISTVNSNITQIDSLVSNGDYIGAYDVLKSTKDLIVNSGYTNFSVSLVKLYEFINKKEKEIQPEVEFYTLNSKADEVISKADVFLKSGAPKEGLKAIKEFVSNVNVSSITDERKSQILAKIKDKYRELALIDISSTVSNKISDANKFVARGEKSAAYVVFEDTIKLIDEYVVDVPEIVSDVSNIRESILSNYVGIGIEVLSNKTELAIINADDLANKKNFTNAMDILSSTIKEIRASKLYYLGVVKEFESKLQRKYDEISEKALEEEQLGEVKGIFDEVKPIIKDAIKLASINDFDGAIKKYQEALKIIEISEYRENPFLKKLKNDIVADIARVEQSKKEAEEMRLKKIQLQEELEKKKKELPWWTRMQKAWTGVGFEISGSILTPQGSDFAVTNLNTLVNVKFHISILPILGLSFGGFYNVNSQMVSSNASYLAWMGMGQLGLRIPIVKQFSIFGDFGTGVGMWKDSIIMRMGKDYILNAGIDLKFSWFGIRMSYDMAFYDDFKNYQYGGSFGIILWATED
jgi:tetratricopeptide (TPR) repeat protein